MGWIKRNLFFVVGGLVSLVLLGGAGYYIWSESARNTKASEDLTAVYETLDKLAKQEPKPGNDKVNNTAIAKEQEQQLRDWITSSAGYFKPVAGIPPGTNISSKDFGLALSRTVVSMQVAADGAGITVPPKYGFSFEAQRARMTFAAGSVDLLAQQLGEVKTLTDILFATRINALDSIQRVRVSEDDLQGSAADYLDQPPLTNELAIITPYVVTFRCFTPELARVLAAISKGSTTLIVKTINVARADAAGTLPVGALGDPYAPALRNPEGYPPGYNPGVVPAAAPPVTGKGGLQTALKEQLLRVVIEVDLVKLLPKS
jgi:hypothetical protein